VLHAKAGARWSVMAFLLLVGPIVGCGAPDDRAPSPTVFTPAHATVAGAVNDFFGIRPTATQPFPFPHKRHIEKKLKCTDYCHESVDKGPIAGIPSVKTCMICHESIASDKPLIKTVADYQKRGIDIAWQRVYGYSQQAHVRFNHAPHIRAKVECSTCHGPIDQQDVAQRNVTLNMGFCVDCHKSRQAPNECLTCHY
jgi:Cytochrome c7 and related cytochrome c